MDLDEKLKKSQRLEAKSYYITEYIFRVLIVQKIILIPLSKTPITPNFITICSSLCAMYSFYCIYSDSFVLAGLFYILYSLLDHTDGILARYKNLYSKFGKFLDDVLDILAFNGVFILLCALKLISLQTCIFVLLAMNIHNYTASLYILKKLKQLKQIKRFGLKKWFLDRGFLLGIDASLLGILISLGLMFEIFELICYIIGGIYIFDLLYRLYELWRNLKLFNHTSH